MSELQLLLLGVALPALVAAAAQILAFLLARRSARQDAAPSSLDLARGAALGLAAGYAAADVALQGWPTLPPTDSTRWTLWAALALGTLAAVEVLVAAFVAGPGKSGRDGARFSWGTRARGGFRGLVCAAMPALILRPLFGSTWSAGEGMLWAVGLAVALLGLAASSEALVLRRPGAALPLALWATSAGSSIALVLSGSLLQGQLAGAIAATLGATIVLEWWRPESHAGRGLGHGATTLLGALWIAGRFYSELPASCAGLLVLSLVAPWAAELPPARRIEGRRAALLRLALALVPAALAALLAWHQSPPLDEYGY